MKEMQHCLLGITGGIAAYKTPELVRLLQRAGMAVRVVMTASAKHFVTPLTLQALSGFPVRDSLWDEEAERAMSHIELARWADIILIAPATADCLAKLACGMADDLLTTLCLASTAKIIVAPAMNHVMWHHAATQASIETLKQRGVVILDPEEGEQACGETGMGRMQTPENIVNSLKNSILTEDRWLMGKTIMITAGPTQEAIDPVRYITNHSSGKMGYALAEKAHQLGAHVILVSGPSALTCSDKITRMNVKSAQDMHNAVMAHIHQVDVFIGAAAVADYRVENCADNKLKKQDTLTLTLIKNPDILADVAKLEKRSFMVGFAAETENILEYARQKLIQKNVDMIIANAVNIPHQGFYSDHNSGWIITAGSTITLPLMSKVGMADSIFAAIHDHA